MPNRVLVGVLAGLLTIGGAVQQADEARASAAPSPPARYALLPAPTRINPASLNSSSGTEYPGLDKPFLPRDRNTYATKKQLALEGKTARRDGVLTPGGAPPAPMAPTPMQPQQPLANFPVMSLAQQSSLFGTDQAVAPPDTQLAAGPNNLVEADNSTLSIWTKSGSFVQAYDLNAFFLAPAGFRVGDPRILYDVESGRWFLTAMAFDVNNNSEVLIAVSVTSDPTGTWNKTRVRNYTTSAILADMPFTGISSDKVVMSWNDFTSTQVYTGAETWVLQKSDLVAGTAVHGAGFGPDTSRFRIVPVQSLSPTTTQWLVYNNADCLQPVTCSLGRPTVGVISITGTPSAVNVTWSEQDPPIRAISDPPAPRQPSGFPVTADIDDRFLSAVWQNGTLWVSGNDACTPAGDFVTRSCMRLVGISFNSAIASVTYDVDQGLYGLDLYFPAVMLNDAGDLFVAYSESSSTVYPSATASDASAASPTTLSSPVTIAAGLNSYRQGTRNRWGDYSAAARDPVNPADVWVTAEYQPSATTTNTWATATARLAFQPSITTVTPSLGLLAGGQSVTLTGDHFQSSAAVNFGTNPGSSIQVLSSTQIKVTTPPAAATGTVDVTVSDPDGTTATATAAYTYSTALGTAYTPMAPSRLLDTRQSTGPIGPGGSLSLRVTGGTTGVPTSAQSVVLNVTVTNTTAPGYLTAYPAGTPRPLISNLNWVAGQTVPNLVAVPVGSGGQITLFNRFGSTDLVVDLEGYFGPINGSAGQLQPLPPSRILDTRTGNGAPQGKLGSVSPSMTLQVTSRGGVLPTGVSAVVMNVTVTNPTAPSYITVWPSSATMPLASNLNFTASETVANRVIVPVSASGQVSIYVGAGATDVVADVNGYFTDASGSGGQLFYPVASYRSTDTRLSSQTLGPGGNLAVQLGGVGSVPLNATAAVLNVTTTNTTASGFFTVFPFGASLPLASDINWVAGATVPNLVVVKLSGGAANIFNSAGSTDAVVDVFGYFGPAPGVVVGANPSTMTAAPASKSTITATVTLPDGTAGANDPVTFKTSGGASCGTISGSPATTDATGTATATYTASTTTGTCTVTATDTKQNLSGTTSLAQT